MPHAEPLRLTFPDGRGYDVAFKPLSSVPELLRACGMTGGRCLVVTDPNVARLHLARLVEALEAHGWAPEVHLLPAGEEAKTLESVAGVYGWALGGEVPQRSTPVLALGGGAVGDAAGFAAATLLRGLPLVHLPTTLVAQVDSSIGGKTGINHAAGKNLIGAVYQPRLVVADPATLETLPAREWHSGLAEVIKAALIADADFFDWLEADWETIETRDHRHVARLVGRAAAIKAAIVMEDEHEAGRRALLNFGHTFGHAIERATGYAAFTHGEAVALGMRAALHLSGRLYPALDRLRAERLVRRLVVPTRLDVPLDHLMAAMRSDKKRAGGRSRFIVLREIGSAEVVDEPPVEAIEEAWRHVTEGV